MVKKTEEKPIKKAPKKDGRKTNPNLIKSQRPDQLEQPVPRKTKPTKYSPELARKILKLIASGNSNLAIEKMPGMPTRETIDNWYYSEKYPNFNRLYNEARERRAEYIFEESIDIADGTEDKIVGDDKSDGARVQAQKLRVDTRKWFVSVLAPRRYAGTSKVDVTTNGKDLKQPRPVTINYVVPS